jgi:hypothetical protein
MDSLSLAAAGAAKEKIATTVKHKTTPQSFFILHHSSKFSVAKSCLSFAAEVGVTTIFTTQMSTVNHRTPGFAGGLDFMNRSKQLKTLSS